MKIFLLALAVVIISYSFEACKSSGTKTFCDTACLKDTMKFSNDAHPLKPYLYISARNCVADTLIWSYAGMGTNRKSGFADLLNNPDIRLNKNNVKCFIGDTTYAWLMFNDCVTGRGYILKLPYNKTNPIGRKSSAINSTDPKYSVASGLSAYTDRGNIFVEEMATGKKAMMTFGKMVDIDYDAIHDYIDSVNISPGRIWVKVKIDNEWATLQKDITLQ